MTWKDAAAQMMKGRSLSAPYIQWINDGAILLPRTATGGFAMPEAEAAVAGDVPKGASKATARFRAADEGVFFTPTLRAAILAVRFGWVKDGSPVPDYVEGARGKARALALVEGEKGPFLAVLTFSGLASRDFLAAWKLHRARVRKATRAAGQEAPASLFFMTLRAGKIIRLEHGAVRTPIEIDEDFDPDRDYIGNEALSFVEMAKEWGNGSIGANGKGKVEPDLEAPEPEWAWALEYPCPIKGRTFAAGTPMGDLPDAALEYIAENAQRLKLPPEAATAAAIVLALRRQEQVAL